MDVVYHDGIFLESGTYWYVSKQPGISSLIGTFLPQPAYTGSPQIMGYSVFGLDTVSLIVFDATIGSFLPFPVSVGIDSEITLMVSVSYSLPGSYDWSKLEGPGNVTFPHLDGANTRFSADEPGKYKVKCEFFPEGATKSYTAESGDIYVVELKITNPNSFPWYLPVRGSMELNASVVPETLNGAYVWSKVSGPGEVTFLTPNNAMTNFSADTPGVYVVKCKFFAGVHSQYSYAVESGEIYVVGVEFFEHGTTNEISEAHVGTDGDSNTIQDGETIQIDIKISPSDLTLDFESDNTEAEITPSSGSGTTTMTITGKGDGYSDSEIRVKKDSAELSSLELRIHKPDRVEWRDTTSLVPEEGYIGKGNIYCYVVYDLQDRIIPNLDTYRYYERLHVDRNEDGLGGYWNSTLVNFINCTPYPGQICENANIINDIVNMWIPEGTTSQELGNDAIVQWHNSFYLMDIYLGDSTYKYTWTPVISGNDVIELNMNKQLLDDSQRVTEANDDID